MILGDPIISNPIRWSLASVDLTVAGSTAAAPQPSRGPRPEIKHMFREPERRPPQVISSTFTGLSLAPFLVLLILWGKLGINVKNFTFSLSALLFHGGLAGKLLKNYMY